MSTPRSSDELHDAADEARRHKTVDDERAGELEDAALETATAERAQQRAADTAAEDD